MKDMKNFTQRILFSIILLTVTANLSYSQTIVKGIVRDAVSKAPLQSVSVYVQGGKGVMTKEDGSYEFITVNSGTKALKFSFVGFKTISKQIIPNKEQTIDVELPVGDTSNNVTVKSKRGK